MPRSLPCCVHEFPALILLAFTVPRSIAHDVVTWDPDGRCTNGFAQRPRWLHRPLHGHKMEDIRGGPSSSHMYCRYTNTFAHNDNTYCVQVLSDCSTERPRGSRLHDALWKHDVITCESLGALNVGCAERRSQFLLRLLGSS